MLDLFHSHLPDKPKASLWMVFKWAGNESHWSVFEAQICLRQVILFTPQRDSYELSVERISALQCM